MENYLAIFISFIIAYFSTPLLRRIAVKLRIVDFPGKRKIHKKVTPLLGGVGIYLGFVIAFLFDSKNLHSFFPILLGGTIILILGLIDDTRGSSAQFRFICEVLIAFILIMLGVRVEFMPRGLWGNIGEICITILWIVGVTNAYNYLDGMDGLATGSSVVNLLSFALILYSTKQHGLGTLALILGAACLGFLPYNFKRAKIFLGDAGSTLLGFTLASIALVGSWAEDNIVKISIPILVLGVPIFDMIFTTIMRIREKKIRNLLEWLQYGGRDHFHHYLVDLGMQPMGAVIFIYFITLSLGLSAIMVSNDKAIEAFLTLSQAGIIFGIIAALIVVGKRHRSGWV